MVNLEEILRNNFIEGTMRTANQVPPNLCWPKALLAVSSKFSFQ